jgi:hypothetical protein
MAVAHAAAFAGALVLGCRSAPADPVTALLAELEESAEARDAERFATRLSSTFQAARSLDRAQAVAQLRRYIAAYESVALDVYGVEIDREGGAARVRCVVEFSGRARRLMGLEGLLPPTAVYRFELEVADEDGTWRVRAASWEAAEEA